MYCGYILRFLMRFINIMDSFKCLYTIQLDKPSQVLFILFCVCFFVIDSSFFRKETSPFFLSSVHGLKYRANILNLLSLYKHFIDLLHSYLLLSFKFSVIYRFINSCNILKIFFWTGLLLNYQAKSSQYLIVVISFVHRKQQT